MKRRYTHMNNLSIYIANLGAYNEGRLEGAWLTLPATEEEIRERGVFRGRY